MANLIGVDFKMFFDRTAVENRINRQEKRILSGTGAYAMRIMRNSMKQKRTKKGNLRKRFLENRKRKIVAGHGQPPLSHEGTLKRLIFFGLDTSTDSLVVGPKIFKGSGKTIASVTVPQLLEFGGTATLTRQTKDGRKRVSARYRPHPYAAPVNPLAARKMADITQRLGLL